MLMPETPMHEDHLLAGPEDKVGFAGKILGVEAVAVAHPVNERPDQHLGLHARRTDGGHVAGAFRRAAFIHRPFAYSDFLGIVASWERLILRNKNRTRIVSISS